MPWTRTLGRCARLNSLHPKTLLLEDSTSLRGDAPLSSSRSFGSTVPNGGGWWTRVHQLLALPSLRRLRYTRNFSRPMYCMPFALLTIACPRPGCGSKGVAELTSPESLHTRIWSWSPPPL